MAAERKRCTPSPVRELLLEAFRGKPLEKRLKESRIWDVWPEAVGEQIARRAAPLRFSDGVLTVGVSNGPWMHQLSMLRNELASRLNAHLGDQVVREIFVTARMPRAEKSVATPPVRPASSPEAKKAALETAATVQDPELREILESFARKFPIIL